jgi:hypothetical protein
MKKLLFIGAVVTLLTSCNVTSNYYQIYKTNTSENIVKKGDLLVFEDENCSVTYNLWNEGGNVGFNIYNKSNKNLYLNLEESFFVFNGIANNYYKNRVFSNSVNSGATYSTGVLASKSVTGYNFLNLLQTNKVAVSSNTGIVNSSGYSVSYNEEKIVSIPPKTSKYIVEYSINNSLYRDCDLYKYPTKKQINTKSFTKSDSPFVFSNKISYYLDTPDKLIKFDNSFFVSEIANYPESEAFYSKKDENCGQKSMSKSYYFNDKSPDKFYVKYVKGQDSWKN